ncbi:tyrosine-type recombinase/integrase [Paraburkholderia sp.]|uniref:tyrosine-type recombinase/integrase n=1 Tax=Paraburkholderia sp. TaxID=1926495 RepID=UPI00345D88AA
MSKWSEFDLDQATWEIPSERMKRRKSGKLYGPAHVVPLSRQAVEILLELHKFTGHCQHVFPSVRGDVRPMSDGTLSAAFRLMGIDSVAAVPHGWRATARTLAVEQLGFPEEIVEMQLAHTVKDPLGRAYNRTQWLAQRRELMQRWADYLDELRLDSTGVMTSTLETIRPDAPY